MSGPPDAPEASADTTSDRSSDPSDDAVGEPTPPEIDLRPARHRLRVERRILSDERSAFRQFCDRLLAIEDGAPTDAILAHYRGTVMTVPHYWTEYGDTAIESVAAEFGPTLASDLQARDRVGAPTVTALRRAGERSLQARDELVDHIDAERHAVATAAEELAAVRRELLEVDAEDPTTAGGATRLRLEALRERVDAVGRRRRKRLRQDDDASSGPITDDSRCAPGATGDGDDDLPPGRLQSLCYRELAVDWPVLASVEALRDAIETRRRAVRDRQPTD